MPDEIACPICMMTDILDAPEQYECATCGHEWPKEHGGEAGAIEVKDSNGNALADGDSITLIKDLKVKGSSSTLKAGTKVKGIRIVDPDLNKGHDIDAKANGMGVLIKSQFVKKA
jgi:protein PhnA